MTRYRIRFVFKGRQISKFVEAQTAFQARQLVEQQYGVKFNEILSVTPA
jgi:hypothetical protein